MGCNLRVSNFELVLLLHEAFDAPFEAFQVAFLLDDQTVSLLNCLRKSLVADQ